MPGSSNGAPQSQECHEAQPSLRLRFTSSARRPQTEAEIYQLKFENEQCGEIISELFLNV